MGNLENWWSSAGELESGDSILPPVKTPSVCSVTIKPW